MSPKGSMASQMDGETRNNQKGQQQMIKTLNIGSPHNFLGMASKRNDSLTSTHSATQQCNAGNRAMIRYQKWLNCAQHVEDLDPPLSSSAPDAAWKQWRLLDEGGYE